MSRYRHGEEVTPPEGYPLEVRLPPFVYPVRYFRWLRDPEDENAPLAGCVSEAEIWVELSGTAPRWYVLSTIVHEARHLFPWPVDEDTEERCVRMLDYCAPQLFRHNPALASWLTGRDD